MLIQVVISARNPIIVSLGVPVIGSVNPHNMQHICRPVYLRI